MQVCTAGQQQIRSKIYLHTKRLFGCLYGTSLVTGGIVHVCGWAAFHNSGSKFWTSRTTFFPQSKFCVTTLETKLCMALATLQLLIVA